MTSDDISVLRRIFLMLAHGGYDAREQYQGVTALGDLIERLDPDGEKLLKPKVYRVEKSCLCKGFYKDPRCNIFHRDA